MQIAMVRAKLHNVVVTDAQKNYVGSITIDQNLMDAVDLYPNEKVLVVNNTTGARLETYVIKGKRGSGVICLNGAAAFHFSKGDGAIIMSFGMFDSIEAKQHKPKVVFPYRDNTKWKTPEEVVKEMLNMDILEMPNGFDLEYIDRIALQMAFTSEQIIGFIADLRLNIKQDEE